MISVTHVDMLNPPALYTADNTNPTTVPDIKANIAPIADPMRGMRKTGHKGGLFLFRLPPFGIFPDLSTGSGGFARNVVRERRVVMNAIIEHRKNIPPIRIMVHITVKRQITGGVSGVLTAS